MTEANGIKYYIVALDGSQYFNSEKIYFPFCLLHKDVSVINHYSNFVVGATLVRAGSHEILPLYAEEVRYSDGQEKQDCENNEGN